MSNKFTPANAHTYSRHYDEHTFKAKLLRIASQAGAKLLYPALQLHCLLHSSEVPVKDKILIIGALGYLILPADLVPDFIPALGLTDDLTALMLVVRLLSHHLTSDIKRQAREQTDRLLTPHSNTDDDRWPTH